MCESRSDILHMSLSKHPNHEVLTIANVPLVSRVGEKWGSSKQHSRELHPTKSSGDQQKQ
eukprot:4926472-Amphidinium_carterae.1